VAASAADPKSPLLTPGRWHEIGGPVVVSVDACLGLELQRSCLGSLVSAFLLLFGCWCLLWLLAHVAWACVALLWMPGSRVRLVSAALWRSSSVACIVFAVLVNRETGLSGQLFLWTHEAGLRAALAGERDDIGEALEAHRYAQETAFRYSSGLDSFKLVYDHVEAQRIGEDPARHWQTLVRDQVSYWELHDRSAARHLRGPWYLDWSRGRRH
jgi:hypothetical protein